MIAKRLNTRTPAAQREMGLVLGRLAKEWLAIRSAKIGTPQAARRSSVVREMNYVNAYHRCNCPGMDERLREIWRMVAHRDYPAVARLADQWERQA